MRSQLLAVALTVQAGEHLTLETANENPHSVLTGGGCFRSRASGPDESVDVAFSRPGDYSYVCGLHPNMQGAIKAVP